MNICGRRPGHPATVSSHHHLKRARLFSRCGKAGFLSFCQCKETLFSYFWAILHSEYLLHCPEPQLPCAAAAKTAPCVGFHINNEMNIRHLCLAINHRVCVNITQMLTFQRNEVRQVTSLWSSSQGEGSFRLHRLVGY